jgi:hypothetical protein
MNWSRRVESNNRLAPYEGAALPLSYTGLARGEGLEPSTCRFKVGRAASCATPEWEHFPEKWVPAFRGKCDQTKTCLAPPAGFEPASTGLKDRRPVPLDEGGNVWSGQRESNPRPTVWKTAALPLSYTRVIWRRVQESNLPDLSVSSR